MNVGFVVHHYDPFDGTGGYAVELVTRLARDHDVTLYASRLRTHAPRGVTCVHVPALRGRAYATILSFPAAFAAVRRRHDVVHAQGWVTGSADVVTAHIVLAAWRAAARAAGIRSGPGERYLGGWVAGREGALFRRAPLALAPSVKVKNELASFYGRAGPTQVIPHAFPAPRPAPSRNDARARLDLPAAAFVALYVGDARKGLATAIDGVAAAAGSPHLAVVSRSPREVYRARATDRGLAQRFHWIGPLDEMALAYAAADVLLHPTIYDAFGLVVAEAMAAGVPPIVSRHAGSAELVSHREAGWILDHNDVAEIAAALNVLGADPALRDALATGARAVAAHRTWDGVARETVAAYESVRRR